MKKKLLLIYTGGTIGMAKSAEGYIPTPGLLTKAMAENPAFHHKNMPAHDILEYSPLMDSANMSPADWVRITQDILTHEASYDGFIVLHGTDTMIYTAAAVSFMLRHFKKPIIFTGSQVPLIEAHTDARENLIYAMLFAGEFNIPEVCIFFNNRLFRGNRCQKINAQSFNAFASPNYPILGEVGLTLSLYGERILPLPTKALAWVPIKPAKLAVITLFPGCLMDLLPPLIDQGIQGLILRTYGVGNAPMTTPHLLEALCYAQQKQVVVMNCTQCVHGSVDMQSYPGGQQLLEHGVISSYDMTLEATLCKLYYAFSLSSTKKEVETLLQQNLAGEMSLNQKD